MVCVSVSRRVFGVLLGTIHLERAFRRYRLSKLVGCRILPTTLPVGLALSFAFAFTFGVGIGLRLSFGISLSPAVSTHFEPDPQVVCMALLTGPEFGFGTFGCHGAVVLLQELARPQVVRGVLFEPRARLVTLAPQVCVPGGLSAFRRDTYARS